MTLTGGSIFAVLAIVGLLGWRVPPFISPAVLATTFVLAAFLSWRAERARALHEIAKNEFPELQGEVVEAIFQDYITNNIQSSSDPRRLNSFLNFKLHIVNIRPVDTTLKGARLEIICNGNIIPNQDAWQEGLRKEPFRMYLDEIASEPMLSLLNASNHPLRRGIGVYGWLRYETESDVLEYGDKALFHFILTDAFGKEHVIARQPGPWPERHASVET